ncbi:MAG: DNA gyrase subunit A, partial [Proteobacteria bacterium]|nr:DNA gyrase subunit A [Pseudomonadota bacterium]
GEGLILTASENGYGKLTPLEDFPSHGRGGQGVIALQTTERNGAMVAALQVRTDEEIMLISSSGTLVRTGVDQVSIVGRNTQGVRLMRLDEGERLAGVESIGSLGSDVELPEGELASLVAGEEGGPVAAPVAGDDGAPPTAH